VLFIDIGSTSDAPSFVAASDIGHFLVALLERELGSDDWPFNESYVAKTDPEITHFKGVAMPWNAG
jgi:hypothetical protein